jgi:quinol-cytochrome oxidoreductase complex cytochrome b subunit
MPLRIGRYTITSRVLINFLFICFLTGIPVGVMIAAHEDGKQAKWIPFIALFILVGRLLQTMIADFKKDNQLH